MDASLGHVREKRKKNKKKQKKTTTLIDNYEMSHELLLSKKQRNQALKMR